MDLQQIHIFYNGLNRNIRGLLNASAGCSIRKKDVDEARALIETMANEDGTSDDLYGGRKGVVELGTHDAVLAQNKLLSQQIETLTKQLQVV
jgi:hypothetical protein